MDADDRPDDLDFLLENAEVQVISSAELHTLLGTDLHTLVETLLTGAVPMRYPKRNSAEYRQMLQDGIACESLNGVIDGIRQVWDGYGFIGWVDFMGALITSIEKHTPDAGRDAYGMVRIDKILRTDHDEGELMETAVHIANAPNAAQQGFDFASALDAGLEIVATVDSWMPSWQEALRCAASGNTAGMRAALVKCPGLKDEDKQRMNIQAVLVLAMAHMAVVRPANVMAEWSKHE